MEIAWSQMLTKVAGRKLGQQAASRNKVNPKFAVLGGLNPCFQLIANVSKDVTTPAQRNLYKIL